MKLRYMQTNIYLQVPPEIPHGSSVKDPQDYFTALVCGLTSVNVMNIIEHEANVNVEVPEPPYHSLEVQGLRMETEEQDPESLGQKTPSTKSPAKAIKHEKGQSAGSSKDSADQFRTPTPRKRRPTSPPEGTGSPTV